MAPDQGNAIEWVAPEKFSSAYYVRLALGIARLNDGAIRAAARDKNALPYGALIWLSANFFVLILQIAFTAKTRAINNWPVLLVSVSFIVLLRAVLALLQWLFAHLLARGLFKARGSYLEIARAMALGGAVTVLMAIPVVGMLIGGVWLTAIFMCVFEEVDGIERMQACGLALAFNLLFYAVSISLYSPAH